MLRRPWEATGKAAGMEDLHVHDLRETTVTMPPQAGPNLAEIVAVTGPPAPRAGDSRQASRRTRTMADSAIAKLENGLETEFARQTA